MWDTLHNHHYITYTNCVYKTHYVKLKNSSKIPPCYFLAVLCASEKVHYLCSQVVLNARLPNCSCHEEEKKPSSCVSFMCLLHSPVLYFNGSQWHKRALICTSINQQLNGGSYVPNHFLLLYTFIPVVLEVIGLGLLTHKKKLLNKQRSEGCCEWVKNIMDWWSSRLWAYYLELNRGEQPKHLYKDIKRTALICCR